MRVLIVGDERIMLKVLEEAINPFPDVTQVKEFESYEDAWEWAKENTADVAFLDISIQGMGGMAFAKNLLEIQPNCKIIFWTDSTEYVIDKWKMHVPGFLMKPITAETVYNELEFFQGGGVTSC